MAVVILGMGLLERDGLAIAVGLAVAVVAVAWNGLLIVASAELLGWLAGLIGL